MVVCVIVSEFVLTGVNGNKHGHMGVGGVTIRTVMTVIF